MSGAKLTRHDRCTSIAMAELMTSGLGGLELAKRLREDFPRVRLGEVYMAVGLAAALWAADLTKAEIQSAALRNAESAA